MRPRFSLSIPSRTFAGFALVICAFGAVALASIVQHEQTARTLGLLPEGYLPLALDVAELRANHGVFLTRMDGILEEQDTTPTVAYLRSARLLRQSLLERTLTGITRAYAMQPPEDAASVLSGVRAELSSVRAVYSADERRFDDLSRALLGRDRSRAEQILGDLRTRERTVERHLRRASDSMQAGIAAMSADAEREERRSVQILALLALAALLVGLLVTFYTQRTLAPLPRLQERVAAVARGDLDARRLSLTGDDEIGRLAAEFERMVDALAARDARLHEAADRLRALQRMQEQIVEGLRAAVVLVDEGGVVRSVNPSAALLFGVTPADVGRPLAALSLGARIAPLEAAIGEVRAGSERAVLTATPLASTDVLAKPEPRLLDVLVTPFGEQPMTGAERPVLIVAEDVTEDLRTKARLIHSERLAAIGRMAAHVTHEVRNPLSSIGLNVEMLEEETSESGPEVQALLRAIHREVDRLTAVTEEYLRLARLPEPRLEQGDLGETVREVAQFVRAEMTNAGVVFVVDVPCALPHIAYDEAQLRQALLNLLRNAREAMPAPGGTVRVSVEVEGGDVVLRVADDGPGIAPEVQARIFDPFFTTKERGTGLGLPLTQQIVAAHGGRIGVHGAPGQGTTFELAFPIAGDPAAATDLALSRDTAARDALHEGAQALEATTAAPEASE